MLGSQRQVAICSSSILMARSRRLLHRSVTHRKSTAFFSVPSKATAPQSPPASDFMSRLMAFPKDQPFIFQLLVATGKTQAADLVVQVVAEGRSLDQVDWKRNAIFIVFGATYLGGFQYWLMVNKYRQWFPTMDRFGKLSLAEKLKDTAGIMDAGKMVLFDIFVHLPILYFPSYYTVKEFISGTSWNPVDWARDGVAKYIKNSKQDLTAMVRLWGPSDCVQFALPTHIRMPFRHLVSFFWTAYVSFTRGSIDKKQPARAPTETKTPDRQTA
ncbi:hypothetical protein ACA910_016119 [Epithemia clementina (nom. ined.)]